MMHMVLFPKRSAQACECLVVYLDLETNSLDVLSGKIVEIGALVDGSRAMFSTVVHPGHGAALGDSAVHGIPQQELLSGPGFVEAFARLDQFLRYAFLSVLDSDDEVSEDRRLLAVPTKQDLQVCLAAHNGANVDFPIERVYAFECWPSCDVELDLRRYVGRPPCHRSGRRVQEASMFPACLRWASDFASPSSS